MKDDHTRSEVRNILNMDNIIVSRNVRTKASIIFGSLLFPIKAARDDLRARSVPRECPTARDNSTRWRFSRVAWV
jgi:hypothetical protein